MTILTQTVEYRGRDIPISEMKPNSTKKICVCCPSCGEVRETWLRVIARHGNHKCHQCTLKERAQQLEVGTRFGLLTVVSPASESGKSVCLCECGAIIEVDNYNLKSGHTRSCGCLKQNNFEGATRVSGAQHGRWRGGVTPANQRVRQSTEYANWRTEVFERDSFTCQKCGQLGGKLRAHHIECFAENKGKRTDADNGITFCYGCHRAFHALYGRKNNNQQQIGEFLGG